MNDEPKFVMGRADGFALNAAFDIMVGKERHTAYETMDRCAQGAVWRVERKGVVDFLVKYVRPDKVDGALLPELSGEPAVWNWRPMPP